MNERMRFDPAKAAEDGRQDAQGLTAALCNLWDDEDEVLSNDADGKQSATLFNDALAGIIGLAVENRIEECQARLEGFCEVIGPILADALNTVDPEHSNITESEGGEL